MTTRAQKLADIGERVLWTLLQAGAGEALVHSVHISQIWVAPVAAVLAALKSAVAAAVSKNGTAATLPESLDSSDGGISTPEQQASAFKAHAVAHYPAEDEASTGKHEAPEV